MCPLITIIQASSSILHTSGNGSKPETINKTNLNLSVCLVFRRGRQSCWQVTPYALLTSHHRRKQRRACKSAALRCFGNGMGAPSHTELKREHEKPTPAKDTTKPLNFQVFRRLRFPGAQEKQAAGGSEARV